MPENSDGEPDGQSEEHSIVRRSDIQKREPEVQRVEVNRVPGSAEEPELGLDDTDLDDSASDLFMELELDDSVSDLLMELELDDSASDLLMELELDDTWSDLDPDDSLAAILKDFDEDSSDPVLTSGPDDSIDESDDSRHLDRLQLLCIIGLALSLLGLALMAFLQFLG